ncbi:hypothetical protein AXG93_2891s1130 [Marchantia polymorpha subsp. ruderalis]|uniref:Uncharacterized protein n=1 Tax=Marchantia polymorpha subsp. ruderalis TaxID=1480154 RepID=A0A176WM13_MARPO|nr:hypothetical protein AXG93_2891s1130 [Marchantia polymorpha subsp. ruderalis]
MQTQLEESAKDEGRKEETRVPSAQAPLAVADRAGEAGPVEARSPTPLEILARSGAAVAAAEATRSSSRELPRISVATEILDSEDKEDESISEGELEEKNNVLHEHLTLSPKLQKAVLQLRDDAATKAKSEFEK